MQNIFVLFFGRTGSSYLMQVFKSCHKTKVLSAYGEIFTSIDIILRSFNIDNKNTEWAINNPIEYLDLINNKIKNTNIDYLFSKIQIKYFMNLSPDQQSRLINYPDSKIIIIKRNILDTYISEVKAKQVNKMSMVDTSDIKIHLDINDFLEYYKLVISYYKRLTELLRENNKKYLILNYEDIHENRLNVDKINYILEKLKYLDLNLNINHDMYKSINFVFKQDRNTSIKNKILNYHELNKILTIEGLKYLLN
jgi:hypothetical protein